MLLRSHSPLATPLLLSGFTACSKKEEAIPAEAQNIASYTYDGRVVTCEAKQAVIASPVAGYDYLVISMTTIPTPSSGSEDLELTFRRPTGQTANTYLPVSNVLHNSTYPQGLTFQYNLVNRTFEDDGSVSGTFYSEMRSSIQGGTYTVDHTLTNGTFTNVRVK
jgi:hypothetical protein